MNQDIDQIRNILFELEEISDMEALHERDDPQKRYHMQLIVEAGLGKGKVRIVSPASRTILGLLVCKSVLTQWAVY